MSFDVILSQQTKSTFFPPPNTAIAISRITLGINDDLAQETFVGNLRNFRLFGDYLQDSAMRGA